jgi:hypothetical protein
VFCLEIQYEVLSKAIVETTSRRNTLSHVGNTPLLVGNTLSHVGNGVLPTCDTYTEITTEITTENLFGSVAASAQKSIKRKEL